MKAETTMSFREFMQSKDLNKELELTQKEKDIVFLFVLTLVLAVCMGVVSLTTLSVPAYLFL